MAQAKTPAKPKASPTPAIKTAVRSIKWPQDTMNLMAGVRREGARSIGRLNGSPVRMKLFVETIKVLLKYAEARLEWQVENAVAQKATMVRRAATKKASQNAAHVAAAARARTLADKAGAKAARMETALKGN